MHERTVQDRDADLLPVETLLQAVAKGDREALRAVFDREAATLLGVAQRLVNDRTAAEDVLQDAFVAVWRHARQFDPARGSGRVWLLTIVRNTALRRLRGNGREIAFANEPERADPSEVTPETESMRSNAAVALHHCLAQLEERKRQTILLAYMDGLSHAQIAEQLNVPLGTVKSWARRALKDLRECLS